MANKVKFGLKNCYYSVITETYSDSTGKWATSYATPKAIPGSVSISLSQEVSENTFYADNMAYYSIVKSNGYTGSYEWAKVPATVYEDIFGRKRDNNDILVENADDKVKYVALMFEIDGDEKATKYCLYRVQLQKPNIEADTAGESVEPKTESCDLKVLPRLDDGVVLCLADETTKTEAYTSFYTSVPTLSFT